MTFLSVERYELMDTHRYTQNPLWRIFMKFYRLLKNSIYSLISKRTIGARILQIKDNKILLVKHTYQPGWYTIGGTVEPGESQLETVIRELKEETGITLLNSPKLFSVYYSNIEKRDDYISLYIGGDFTQEKNFSEEILEKAWFPLDNLPEETTPATKRRIAEYLGTAAISDKW